MNITEIEAIKNQYPKIVSKDQVYRICHISKATALYLLQSGLIPNVDSGKKTRKYRIQLDDVIAYLQKREEDPLTFKPPENYYAGRRYPPSRRKRLHVPIGRYLEAREFFERELQSYDEVLTTAEVSEFLGYTEKTVVDWCAKNEINHFLIKNKLRFPREYLIDFILSNRCNSIIMKSQKHISLIKSFLYGEDRITT